jgi:LuxR family maltose regulon positive regulatory protein
VLVLDGAELLSSPAASDVVSTTIDHLGPGSVVAVASRTEPSLRVGRLRAQDDVLELRDEDLVMSEHESELLLRGAGLCLDAAEVTTVVRDTEGWPAGLHLAGLALRGQEDHVGAVARFAGDDRIVADYLREELLAGLAQDDVELLTRTSPLARLSGPLCDAVLGGRGSGETLRRLARSGALLSPLDRCEQHFHVHRLLGEMLQGDLRRGEPAAVSDVHRRASAWYESEGDGDAAIDHAIAAGDADHAAELVWRLLPARAAHGRVAVVQGWLDQLSEAQVASRPALAIAAATCRLMVGDRDLGERWLGAAERGIASAPDAQGRPFAAAARTLRAALGRDGVARMGEDARGAYALAADDSPWRTAACLLDGVAAHLTGDRDRAQARLEECSRRAASTAPVLRALCLSQLALVALEEPDLDAGTSLSDRAWDGADRSGIGDVPACALVFAVSAYARAHLGRVDEARLDAVRARRLLGAVGDAPPWFEAEACLALARAELRLSDSAAARALLAQASRALRRVPEKLVVQTWIDDAWGRADTFAEGAVAGPSTLTTAELRVLRFLPSHLSFREVAERLHVSGNTVKTQAHAVYRKLDASSRSEAVRRAREVGLVDG